eukprot:scaffold2274_cov202-Prasinococcus_capsulatus_cf.AAC.1
MNEETAREVFRELQAIEAAVREWESRVLQCPLRAAAVALRCAFLHEAVAQAVSLIDDVAALVALSILQAPAVFEELEPQLNSTAAA